MITIVGAGALGSHVALFLRNYDLRIVDFDRIEQKNILAQFHTKMGLGKNKAKALSQALQGMFGAGTEVVAHKLTKDNWSQVLMDSDLILDCTDNIAARTLIHEYWDEYAVPVLHGALSADGTFARIIWAEDFVADAEGEDGEATCIDGEHLPFFASAAAFMAVEVQRFMKTGKKRSFQLTPTGILRLT
jgi:molybdopterin/thiamine biosynthesis adenylyltransferase